VGFDQDQDLRHAVDVRFAADEAGIRKGARFRGKMLAAAESNLELDPVDSNTEQRNKIGRRCADNIQRKPRQQIFDEVRLVRTQSVPLRRPKKEPCRCTATAPPDAS